jgi:hypothetical protein
MNAASLAIKYICIAFAERNQAVTILDSTAN